MCAIFLSEGSAPKSEYIGILRLPIEMWHEQQLK